MAMKRKYKRISYNKIHRQLKSYKVLTHSLQNTITVVKQFNMLNAKQRTAIIKEYDEKHKILQKQIEGIDEEMAKLCMLVNFHSIATRYDIDPSTVCLCLASPCAPSEEILMVRP